VTGINLEDFDEEINGINLSKLFNAYGPSSIVDREPGNRGSYLGRKNKSQAGARGKNNSLSPTNNNNNNLINVRSTN
jgi:hypothetical protein